MKVFAGAMHIRCPRLGHQVPFDYCRSEDMGRPCGRLPQCWNRVRRLDKTPIMSENQNEQHAAASPAQSKMCMILEAIEKAKSLD